jgi:BirA family biotin operon repressor/biotin-[acetyl-CoA-carboxylase] ligase
MGDTLLMSLVVRKPAALLPLASAVAVTDAVADVVGAGARIKWPNDVVQEVPHPSSGGPALAKLAGILVEARPPEDWVILGIGINVAVSPQDAPPELRDAIASLRAPRDTIEPLLESLLRALEARLAAPADETLQAWRERDALRGRLIAWTNAASSPEPASGVEEGRAEGIDGAGRLIVMRSDGLRVTLQAGEVHLLAAG